MWEYNNPWGHRRYAFILGNHSQIIPVLSFLSSGKPVTLTELQSLNAHKLPHLFIAEKEKNRRERKGGNEKGGEGKEEGKEGLIEGRKQKEGVN